MTFGTFTPSADHVRVTCFPRATSASAAGLCWTTIPLGTSVLRTGLPRTATSPAAFSSASAAAMSEPVTFGTRTLSCAATVRVTALSLSALALAEGS